jgi:broad specificity phosphatase PhoE
MKCYFVRHGQTDFNKENEIMGQLDEPLNKTGIAESRALAEKLDLDFEKIFCSPMQRARQTAEIINEKLNVPIEIHDEIRERSFGSLAGETLEQMDKQTMDQIGKKDHDLTYDYRPFGGEAVADVKARLQKFIEFLKSSAAQRSEQAQKKVLVVTHTGIIRLMYPLCLNKPYTEIDNDSVHIFEI